MSLAQRVDKVVVSKGRKVVSFTIAKDSMDTDALLAAMLGPTGNLRPPAILRGQTLHIGFNEDEYNKVFA